MGEEGEGTSKGTGIEDSWALTMGGLTVAVGEDKVGVSNGEKCGTTVTEQK